MTSRTSSSPAGLHLHQQDFIFTSRTSSSPAGLHLHQQDFIAFLHLQDLFFISSPVRTSFFFSLARHSFTCRTCTLPARFSFFPYFLHLQDLALLLFTCKTSSSPTGLFFTCINTMASSGDPFSCEIYLCCTKL